MDHRSQDDRQPRLFDMPVEEPAEAPPYQGPRRLRSPQRQQVSWQMLSLDQMLPADHEVRAVWEYVERLDLSGLIDEVQAVEGGPGQPALDPYLGLALWLYAVLRAVFSGRELARRCREDLPFMWLCGGVSVNYHTLSDFRVGQGELLDTLLTHSVAVLRCEGLVSLERVAQDGVRVRASAGAGSFRREATLEAALAEAQAHLAELQAEAAEDPAAPSRRQRAARERAARERIERVEEALAQLPEVAARKKKSEPKEGESDEAHSKRTAPRASSTDPDARVMKMPDGGYRPAFNVEFATDTGSQVIVGVYAHNVGSDHGQLVPMVEQLGERHGRWPADLLADNGFGKHADVDTLAAGGTTVYMPPLKQRGIDELTPQPGDSPAVAEWRRRMGTDEAQDIYRERASTAECVNAIARNRGLQQLVVRGTEKARLIALWYAVAHNLRRAIVFGVRW